MKISKSFKQFSLLGLIPLLGINYFIASKYPRPKVIIPKQLSSLNFDLKVLRLSSVGHNKLLSSLYWIATILESDVEHYRERDLNSWMFIRFKTISSLDPYFYQNYEFGGQYLSIIKDDILGASDLYSIGLSKYPDEFNLLRDATFHYYFEARDKEKAIPLLNKLEKHPKTPLPLYSLLARIKNEQGDTVTALNILEERIKNVKDHESQIYKVLQQHIYSLRAEIDLDCLNQKKDKCNKTDYYGYPYILQNNQYVAQYKWEKYVPRKLREKKQ